MAHVFRGGDLADRVTQSRAKSAAKKI